MVRPKNDKSNNRGLTQGTTPAPPVHFRDCITDFFSNDTLDADNKLQCQICGKLNSSQIRFRLKTLPRVLIVHMKRFDLRGSKLSHNVEFPSTFSFD